MSQVEKKFPPIKIKDLGQRGASNFISLVKQCRKTPITLFLGSGVSASAGLPIWGELLKRICTIFFTHWHWEIEQGNRTGAPDNPPKDLSVAFVDDFMWDDTSLEIGEEFSKGNPTLVAQMIKNCIRGTDWHYLLQNALYRGVRPKRSKLMYSLAGMCHQTKSMVGIINYNYDDLFEKYLMKNAVRYYLLWAEKTMKNHIREAIPVYHPHGYKKRKGGPVTEIILTESDYFRASVEPYSWGNLVQSKALSNSTCVFVGTSMTDPNLRRMLRACKGIFGGKHFAFMARGRHTSEKEQMFDSLFDRDLIELGVIPIRTPPKHGNAYSKIPDLIDLLGKSISDDQELWSK